MGFWDTLKGVSTGPSPQQHQQDQQSPQHQQYPSRSSTTSRPHTAFDITSDATTSSGVDAFLSPSTFADPSRLHPLSSGLHTEALEYLNLEDTQLTDLPGARSALPSRGFGDDLCYGTGVSYLSALTVGGLWGLRDGLQRARGQPPRLVLNSVLNAVTRRGPFLGNSCGVIAIIYNCVNSSIGYLRGRHDAANTVAAGALSGMLFRCTKGVRPMLISGGIVATVAGAWAVTSTYGGGV